MLKCSINEHIEGENQEDTSIGCQNQLIEQSDQPVQIQEPKKASKSKKRRKIEKDTKVCKDILIVVAKHEDSFKLIDILVSKKITSDTGR